MTTTTRPAAAVRTTSFERGTFLTTDLAAARRFLEEFLGLECVRFRRDALLVREAGHRPGEPLAGEPYWVLEVREVATVANPQAVLNHWGVAVPKQGDVDRAYQAALDHQERYGLKRIQKPRAAHGAYSFYFEDRDSNWWEVEHRIPNRQYSALRERGDAC